MERTNHSTVSTAAVFLRPKASNRNSNTRTDRPNTCFLPSRQLEFENRECNVSIQERLARLQQSGEECWKSRLKKPNAEHEIKQLFLEPGVQLRPKSNNNSTTSKSSDINRQSVIANRLSSLMESQSQWRKRIVPDADKVEVDKNGSKVSTPTPVTPVKSLTSPTTPNNRVTLRETPKRIGLRGSTLNESALLKISSRLNTVLGQDKKPFQTPLSKESLNKSESFKKDSSATERVDETIKNVSVTKDVVKTTPSCDREGDSNLASFFTFDVDKLVNQTEKFEKVDLDSLKREPIKL